MIDKKIKNSKESRRRGVLNEDLDSKLDLVLEGYAALDKKIDDKVDGLEAKMNEKFDMVFEDLDELKQFQSEANVKFDVVFEELHTISDKVDRLEGEVDKLERVVGVSS